MAAAASRGQQHVINLGTCAGFLVSYYLVRGSVEAGGGGGRRETCWAGGARGMGWRKAQGEDYGCRKHLPASCCISAVRDLAPLCFSLPQFSYRGLAEQVPSSVWWSLCSLALNKEIDSGSAFPSPHLLWG